MLNAAGVLEQLFSPTVVFEVMGALECPYSAGFAFVRSLY
jgi:hypothetical protein